MDFRITEFIEYQIYCDACGEAVENDMALDLAESDVFDSREDAIKAATEQGFQAVQSGNQPISLCSTCAKDLDRTVPVALRNIDEVTI